MKKTFKNLIVFLLIVSIVCPVTCYGQSENQLQYMIEQTAESLKNSMESKEKYLLKDENYMPAGSSSSDWIAMVFAFSGKEEAYKKYLKDLEAYVEDQYVRNGYLDRVKATEYERISLTMLALGGDPTKVKVKEKEVNLLADGIYNFHGESLDLQGANGLIYGLLALDALVYEVPKDAKFTRELIVEQLLAYQSENGSFGFGNEGRGDVDITAMALQALAPYTRQENVLNAVNKALKWLSGQMTQRGTFVSYGNESAEATAQVILAMCALGMDPASEIQLLSDNNKQEKSNAITVSPLEGLAAFRMENGMYMHTLSEGEENTMSTYQALLALEAASKLQKEDTWIFDFSDYTPPKSVGNQNVILYAAIGVGVVAIMSVLGVRKRTKNSKVSLL